MARRRYQLSRCPACGSSGLTVTSDEAPPARRGDAGAEHRWLVVGAQCAHGCEVATAEVS